MAAADEQAVVEESVIDVPATIKKSNRTKKARVSAPYDEKLTDVANEMAEVLGQKKPAEQAKAVKPKVASKKTRKRKTNPVAGWSLIRTDSSHTDKPVIDGRKIKLWTPLKIRAAAAKAAKAAADKLDSTKSADTAFTFETVTTAADTASTEASLAGETVAETVYSPEGYNPRELSQENSQDSQFTRAFKRSMKEKKGNLKDPSA